MNYIVENISKNFSVIDKRIDVEASTDTKAIKKVLEDKKVKYKRVIRVTDKVNSCSSIEELADFIVTNKEDSFSSEYYLVN